jgi:gliding motility-associated-like protein
MPSPARIDIVINGVVIGNALAPSSTCGWVQRSYIWNSGVNTNAQICIYDHETAANGNDFAIDDLSFVGPTVVCNLSKSVTITVNNPTTPSFEPIIPICSGQTLGPLPTTSGENISGTWQPALNNTATTTYTFTPNPNQCANATTLEIVVNNGNITPTFNAVSPICAGGTLNTLPTTSLNNISGTWTPPLNNQVTTTYTFTPDPNQCATSATLEVIVFPSNLTPTFNFGNTITSCFKPLGEVPPIMLPTTSDNGIPGFWSPDTINYSVLGESVYTFTPIVNTCASTFVLTVTIIETPEFTINAGCDGDNFVLSVTLFEIKENSNFTWYNEQNEVIGTNSSLIITTKGTYKVVKELNGCRGEQTIVVPSVYCKIPKGISPNDDSLNDFFDLSNLNVAELQIFNRYGTEVYSKKNYKNEWNGKTNSGKELPEGTYFYVINFETGKAKTGWVYINKEY